MDDMHVHVFLKDSDAWFRCGCQNLWWGWNIFLLWNAEIEIYCYLNNSYSATILYRHSLIYVNIHAAIKIKELFGRFDFDQTALTSDVYMQNFLFHVLTGNHFLYNCQWVGFKFLVNVYFFHTRHFSLDWRSCVRMIHCSLSWISSKTWKKMELMN